MTINNPYNLPILHESYTMYYVKLEIIMIINTDVSS